MITLKNIKKTGEHICADCYVEDEKNVAFALCINIENREIVKLSPNKMNTYVHMAKKRLLKLIENNEDIPMQLTYTWY